MRRLPAGTGETCFGARPIDGSLLPCQPLRTTPGGREIWRTSAQGADEQPFADRRIIRRFLVLVIGSTLVEVESVNGSPGVPSMTDAEIDALIDSLHAISYDEFRTSYPGSANVRLDVAYFDDTQPCLPPSPGIPFLACGDDFDKLPPGTKSGDPRPTVPQP